eukprot:690817-Rhodomonas_salina.3
MSGNQLEGEIPPDFGLLVIETAVRIMGSHQENSVTCRVHAPFHWFLLRCFGFEFHGMGVDSRGFSAGVWVSV